MRTFYNALHAQHQGRFEMYRGALVPCHEVPARADDVLAELLRRQTGPVHDPYAMADAVLTTVHSKRYLQFLETAWDQWVALDPANASRDALPSVWPTRTFRTDVEPVNFAARMGLYSFDAGSPLTAGTWVAARAGAACAVSAAACIVQGERAAFALSRPPGHHAEPDQGRGYCVFGNAVIAIRHAQRVRGVGRVAVVDWDVHHGNGTETAFIEDPSVLTISVHQDRCYPVDAGGVEVTGNGAGAHTNLNVPLPAGSGHGAYLSAFERAVIPALERFRAELVIVTSGLDASAMDPLGRMMCTSATYRELTRRVMAAAATSAGGRIVATHEGGYSNAYVPFCGLAVIETLAGITSGVTDPYLDELMQTAGHELLPHQTAAIDAAAKAAERVGSSA